MNNFALFVICALVIYICTELKEIEKDIEWIKSHLYNLEHKNDKNDIDF